MTTTTENLKPENQSAAQACADSIDQYIRWRNERSVQLDGDFTLVELKRIVKAMEEFT